MGMFKPVRGLVFFPGRNKEEADCARNLLTRCRIDSPLGLTPQLAATTLIS